MMRRSFALAALALAPLPFAALHCSGDQPATDAGADVVTPGIDGGDAGEGGPTECVDSQCPSGQCSPDGTCAAPCMEPGMPCTGAGLTCCGKACVDLSKNPRHCGACGVACTGAQFCNAKACKDTVLANLCENPKAAIILDGIANDETAAGIIKGALVRDGGCAPPTVVRDLVQGTGGSQEVSTGRPTLGPGESYVAAGGGFGQKAVDWLNKTKNAPVYTAGDSSSYSFIRSKDDGIIIKAPLTMLTANHDYFVIYTATDPKSGTLVLASYGLLSPGTAAAAFFFDTQVMPNRATFTKGYYAYEWTDANMDGKPDATDTYLLLDSGP